MTPHCTFSICLELDDAQAGQAREIIETAFLAPQEASDYRQMAQVLPDLHFMAIVVFESDHHDPLLVIEVNCDGARDRCLAALERGYGDALRGLLRCAKRPRDKTGAQFDAVTQAGAQASVAPFLATCAVAPMTPFRGARGMSRARIVTEAQIYDAAQQALGDGTAYAADDAGAVHRALRHDAVLRPLLAGDPPDPAPWKARLPDWAALVMALAGLYAALGLPGFILAAFVGPVAATAFFLALILAGIGVWPELRRFAAGLVQPAPAPGTGVRQTMARLRGPVLAGALLAVPALVLALIDGGWHRAFAPEGTPTSGLAALFWGYAVWLLAGLAAALFSLLAIMALLRGRERTDPVHDPAVPAARTRAAMAAMTAREDQIAQNHMASLLIVKPGSLRALVLRASHLLLSRLARSVFSDGILGSMRTIHFAHWSLLNNGSRLLFVSNFDGSWDSYLSDFTEKASRGVNLAWANCMGFAPAAFILTGGSQNARQFKAWARHSMAPTLFWFSAYRDLSVGEVHRNARVAAGLRRAVLPNADVWARDL